MTFRLGKEELGIWNNEMKFTVVPGKVIIAAGHASLDGNKVVLEIV